MAFKKETKVGVLIVGAGPTGLGAASRLHQKHADDWILIDQAPDAGGLACTDVTAEGFLFDMGGHVIFSHYAYFDDLIEAAVGVGDDVWNTLQRVSYVRLKKRWIAYPFQNNIAALDDEDKIACLAGMAEALALSKSSTSKPANFDEWILRTLGPGIADIFMRPYNFKVWAYPTTSMQCEWLGERVAAPNIKRAIANVIHNKEDAGWGPNAVFRFPKQGGTGSIWTGVSAMLPQDKLKFGNEYAVTGFDPAAKKVTLASGRTITYNSMITTIPLDITLKYANAQFDFSGLKKSASHIIGIGFRGECPHGSKCWLYFPEDDCPFYRVTVFSNYADGNCPMAETELATICDGTGAAGDGKSRPGPYWSLMFEVSESELKPVDMSDAQLGEAHWPAIVRNTLLGAVTTSLIAPTDQIVSIYHRRLEYGYPTPSLGRDEAVPKSLAWLRERSIWSRGRFGSWKYEVANQDHSVMQGVEAVDNILSGSPELTLRFPDIVNASKNVDIRFSKRLA